MKHTHKWIKYERFQECCHCRIRRGFEVVMGKAVMVYTYSDGETTQASKVPPCEGAPRHLDSQGFPK
jgi:hypothetical protein